MMEKTSERIQAIIGSVQNGLTIIAACHAAGVDRQSFFLWRKQDPSLQIELEEAKSSRVTVVEDALYKKAAEGNVQAIIFFLKNKAGYKDSPQFSVNVEALAVTANPLDHISDEDLIRCTKSFNDR